MSPSATRQQTSAMTRQASAFLLETQRVLDSIALVLDNPGRNVEHSYAELVRLAAQVRDTSKVYAEHLALTAYQEPSTLSLRRLAPALGVSVNTLRRRLNGLRTDFTEDPFSDESGDE